MNASGKGRRKQGEGFSIYEFDVDLAHNIVNEF